MPPSTSPATQSYIKYVVGYIREHWQPTLGYGWTDTKQAKLTVSSLLKNSELLWLHGLANWGIDGLKIQDSHFAFIGTWASMMDYYYDSFFAQSEANSKHDLDRQILWAQQSVGGYDDETWKSNSINKAYVETTVQQGPDHLRARLGEAYHKNKEAFKNDAWTSLLSVSGPGEQIIYSAISNSLKVVNLLSMTKGDKSSVSKQMADIETFSDILNMAWLEDLFTRQKVPIILFNKLNPDELLATREAVRRRDAFVDDLPENIPEFNVKPAAGAAAASAAAVKPSAAAVKPSAGWAATSSVTATVPSAGAVTLILFEKILESFYSEMEKAQAHKDSTLKKLAKLAEDKKKNFECLKISGLLKVDTGSFEQKPEYLLTGTGKEFFYLLAKGATPFICGEFFILSAGRDSSALAKKLASIPKTQKLNLLKYYSPMKQEPKYSEHTKKFSDPMPFMNDNPDAFEELLIRIE